MHLVVMPFRNLTWRQPFGKTRAQKSKRPAATLILNVGHEIIREQTGAGHLCQLKERAEQTRLATWKDEAITIRWRVVSSGSLNQVVPGARRQIDQVGAIVQ